MNKAIRNTGNHHELQEGQKHQTPPANPTQKLFTVSRQKTVQYLRTFIDHIIHEKPELTKLKEAYKEQLARIKEVKLKTQEIAAARREIKAKSRELDAMCNGVYSQKMYVTCLELFHPLILLELNCMAKDLGMCSGKELAMFLCVNGLFIETELGWMPAMVWKKKTD